MRLIVFLALLAVLLCMPIWHAAMEQTTWYDATLAAWVQGVGSVIAVAAAALISVMQAKDQKKRDVEQLRMRALDAAEDRLQVLLTAIKVCEWTCGRFAKTAQFVAANNVPAIKQILPMVIPELAASAARLAALNLHGQHMIIRENMLAAEGIILSAKGALEVALTGISEGGANTRHQASAQLAKNLQSVEVDLAKMVESLKGGAVAIAADARRATLRDSPRLSGGISGSHPF